MIIRERNGRLLPAVFRSEGQALSFIRSRIAKGTIINADESGSWDALHAQYEMKRINHEEAYSLDGACTNWAEEFFSRMRRAEQGHHHHIAGPYLLRFAQEASWREDHRRISNGEQVHIISGLAMKRGPSIDFSGYWQRHVAAYYYFVSGGFGMLMAKRRSQDSTSHLEIDWASSRSANGANALLAGLSRYRT